MAVENNNDDEKSSIKSRAENSDSASAESSSADSFRTEYTKELFSDSKNRAGSGERTIPGELSKQSETTKEREHNKREAPVLPSLTLTDDSKDKTQADQSPVQTDQSAEIQNLPAEQNPDRREPQPPPEEPDAMKDPKVDIGFFADDHHTAEGKDAFINALKDLQKQGVNTIAMELFTKETQKWLDQYINPKNKTEEDDARKALKDHLDKVWNPDETNAENAKEMNKKIMEILDKAKELGMRVLALEPDGLDMRPEHRDTEKQKKLSEMRDSTWEHVLRDDKKENPNARYVVFQGGFHLQNQMPGWNSRTLRWPRQGSAERPN